MKKQYIISFIVIVSILIISVITVGIVANTKLKDSEDDKYYKIGEAKIYTIRQATNIKPSLVNYSYGNNTSVFIKYYEYEIKDAEGVVSLYTEYLTADENFEIIYEEAGVRTFKKVYEERDTFEIVISYVENVIELELTYTYIE